MIGPSRAAGYVVVHRRGRPCTERLTITSPVNSIFIPILFFPQGSGLRLFVPPRVAW